MTNPIHPGKGVYEVTFTVRVDAVSDRHAKWFARSLLVDREYTVAHVTAEKVTT